MQHPTFNTIMKRRNLHRSIIVILVLVTIGFTLSVKGQDAHFSQFYANPLLLNPALTGTSDGRFRVSSAYRDQWRSALDDPFRTYTLSGDVSYPINEKSSKYPDRFAVGINFFGDRVSTIDFNTTQLSVYGAYHKSLDQRTKQFISAGFYIGVGQKNINFENLTFEDQFNAVDGYTLPSGEFLPNNNFGYADLGMGINYSISPGRNTHFYIGAGVFHVNTPNISFYKDERTTDPNLITRNLLDPRFTLYTGASFKLPDRWSIQPRVLIMVQDVHKQYNFGNNFRYQLDNEASRFFHIGPWLRITDHVDGAGPEAFVLAFGFETGSFLLGLSYDHNLKDLSNRRAGLHSFELSFTFTGEFYNQVDFCPRF